MLVSTRGRAVRKVHLVESKKCFTRLLTDEASLLSDGSDAFLVLSNLRPVRSERGSMNI